jgi:FkbM family methyltransferase
LLKGERLKFKQEAWMVFLNNFNQEKISWVKIDTEEAEYEILRGLRRTILEFALKIIVEVQCKNER